MNAKPVKSLFLNLQLIAIATALCGCPINVPNVRPVAELFISESTLLLTSAKDTVSFQVWNSGDSNSRLEFALSASANWINLDKTSGTSNGPNDVHTITFSIDEHNLSKSRHTGTIAVLSTAGSKTISVTLDVDDSIVVPNLVGQSQSTAELNISNVGLIVGTVQSRFGEGVAPGNIISQAPAFGSEVSAGSEIELVVSLGPPVLVPNVSGAPLSDAESSIADSSLIVGSIQEANSETVPNGHIILQSPVTGTEVPLASAVDLIVSSGLENQRINLHSDVSLEMLTVPSGSFAMGSDSNEDNQAPPHIVNITNRFQLGKYEITKAQWQTVMNTTPWVGQPNVLGDTKSPAVYISWNDAQEFIANLNNLTGKVFRLPTEAEWEYACRAGVQTAYFFGNDEIDLPQHAWFIDNAWYVGERYAHIGGTKSSNAWGFYDMSGNVAEWCNDWYDDEYFSISIADDPAGPSTGTERVERGGSFSATANENRCAYRTSSNPAVIGDDLGFRVVRILNPTYVPNVIGLPQLDAESIIETAGMTLGTLTEAYSPNVVEGAIISQNPEAAIGVTPGSSVDMVVSLGALVTGRTETHMLPGDVPLEMVYIEGGTFMMGAFDGEAGANRVEETPRHQVTLTQGYWLGKYEITKAQWSAIIGTEYWDGQDYVIDDPNSPACYINWILAQQFVSQLNAITGKVFRLPTEAEWEHAARAGTTTRFYWGDDADYTEGDDYAWWSNNAWLADQKYAHVVGQKVPNPWGLYDIIGNVWELCQDSFSPNYYTTSPSIDPLGADSGKFKSARGGAIGSHGSYCRSAKRNSFDRGIGNAVIGFRLAR